MPDFFELRPFESFEIWLNSLLASHQVRDSPFRARDAELIQRNYLPDLRTTLEVLETMDELLRQAAAEMAAQQKGDSDLIRRPAEQTPREELLRRADGRPHLADLANFWEFLDRLRLLGNSLLRLDHLSRMEYRNFGDLFSEAAGRFQSSGHFDLLRSGSANSAFRYLVQREIVRSLEIPGIQEQLEVIFADFFNILRHIKFIGDEMKNTFKPRKLLILFGYCYHSHLKFLTLLQESRGYLDRYEPELVDAIFSTSFALKMETKKVFEQRLGNIESEKRIKRLYAEMEDAQGLIQNAFRECFVNLVRLLNPQFDERRLFEDMRKRYDDTLTLIDDLVLLDRLSREAGDDPELWTDLLATLERFQATSMRSLFFKDWEAIEEADRELRASPPDDRGFLLHSFSIFLTTLLSEVSKRSVLSKFEVRRSRSGAGSGQ